MRDVPRRLELSSDGFDVEDVDMSSECEDEDGGEVDYEDEVRFPSFSLIGENMSRG